MEGPLKDLTESLGKETIYMMTNNTSRGHSPSYTQNQQKLGKELMSMDELSVMDGSKCILQLRGVRPFLSDKFDITKHRNYRYLSDFNPKYAFDIGKYVNKKLKVNPDEQYDFFDCGAFNDEEMPDGMFNDFQADDLEPI